ncbi:MAG: cysteine hydrolase family protein [Myxococcota bacterium]
MPDAELTILRPALVVVDVQKAIDHPRWGPRNHPQAERVIAGLLALWRARGWPLFHVRHDSTEPDSPYRPGQEGHDFKPEVAPLAGEAVLAKTVHSAFVETELRERLMASGQDAVVFAGVLTHNSLEATVRASADLGFRSFVVADACWSVDTRDLRGHLWPAEDVHALSLAHMHGEYATVLDSDALRARLPAPGSGED